MKVIDKLQVSFKVSLSHNDDPENMVIAARTEYLVRFEREHSVDLAKFMVKNKYGRSNYVPVLSQTIFTSPIDDVKKLSGEFMYNVVRR